MSFRNFVPEIWSNKILGKLRSAHVYGQPGVVNRDYEGEIRNFGDTVRINSVGEVTLFDYVANTDMPDPEELTDSQITLVIDTQKGFNFQVDDVDVAQAKGVAGVLGQAFESAGYKLSGAVDLQLATKMVAAATLTTGTNADPIEVSPSTIYTSLLLNARTKLNRANVPMEGRWIALPPELVAVLLSDDKYVLPATQYTPVLNAEVGRAAGFRVLESNLVPEDTSSVANYKILAGTSIATSFAEQIVHTEPYRMEKRFADAVKGLHVYGSKVVRPGALYCASVNKTIS